MTRMLIDSYSLIVLLFGDLFHLIQQLANANLQLGHFLFLRYIRVVNGMLSHLNVQVNAQLRSTKPGGAVRVHTDDMLTGCVRCKRDFT